jgi:hypothetical protein
MSFFRIQQMGVGDGGGGGKLRRDAWRITPLQGLDGF